MTPAGADQGAGATRPLTWDVRGAAEQLSLSERYVRQLIADGRLRALKVGARTIVLDTELQRFLSAQPELRRSGSLATYRRRAQRARSA